MGPGTLRNARRTTRFHFSVSVQVPPRTFDDVTGCLIRKKTSSSFVSPCFSILNPICVSKKEESKRRERNGRPDSRSVQGATTPSKIRNPETLRSQAQTRPLLLQIHRNRRNRRPDHGSNQIHRPQRRRSLRRKLYCRIHLSAV